MLSCPICDSSAIQKKFIKNDCQFIECGSCGFIAIHPPPLPDTLTALYGQTYYQSWGMDQGDDPYVREIKMKTAAGLLEQVENFREPGTLLDIGCAAGHFLEAAAIRGWEIYGVEVSEYSAVLAKRKFGDRIYKGSFEAASFPEAFFDCILLSDVLEHFPDPRPVFGKIKGLLKAKGILAIVTPDTESLSAKILKTSWNHYEKEHLSYFNRKNIQLCLKKNGLIPRVVKTSRKAMNLKYMLAQMTAYPHPLLTPLIRLINKVLPGVWLMRSFWVVSGDMLVIAQKGEEADVG